jgi:hypothetical protein
LVIVADTQTDMKAPCRGGGESFGVVV